MSPTMLSPRFNDTMLSTPPTLEEKINVFEDRVLGWQLNVADAILNGSEASPRTTSALPDSGFASLSILTSYFEMIAQHDKGESSIGRGRSPRFFIHGFKMVYGHNRYPQEFIKKSAAALYDGVRCGLYHDGMAKAGVWIYGEYENAIAYNAVQDTVLINPHLLVRDLKQHFQSYIQSLRDPSNVAKRENFDRRFGL